MTEVSRHSRRPESEKHAKSENSDNCRCGRLFLPVSGRHRRVFDSLP
jgi:hypothetical protein